MNALNSTKESTQNSMDDSMSFDDLADIRARLGASRHIDAKTLKMHYVADVRMLLDEVDRLRYKVGLK